VRRTANEKNRQNPSSEITTYNHLASQTFPLPTNVKRVSIVIRKPVGFVVQVVFPTIVLKASPVPWVGVGTHLLAELIGTAHVEVLVHEVFASVFLEIFGLEVLAAVAHKSVCIGQSGCEFEFGSVRNCASLVEADQCDRVAAMAIKINF
jgi:hypothetical protein